jgi:hypothetical protein
MRGVVVVVWVIIDDMMDCFWGENEAGVALLRMFLACVSFCVYIIL